MENKINSCGCPHPESEHGSCEVGPYCKHENCRCVDGTYYGEMDDIASLKKVWEHLKSLLGKMNFLHFVECAADGRKTKVWMVCNKKNEELGAVYFRPQWKKYIFRFNATSGKIELDAGCLREIADFTESQSKAWRESL